MLLVILPWAHNPFILDEILKRRVCGDHSTVDQINFANKNEQLFITEPFLISTYHPRYAMCSILFLIVCITFSRCLAKIDRWATGCFIGTVLLFQTASILWNLGMENCNWFCKRVIYITTIGYFTVYCKTRDIANYADDYFHACSEMPTVTHFA